MTWDPTQYERFKAERSQPFYDLLAKVSPASGMRAVDLGCGTGELTRVMHERLGCVTTVGYDSSKEMLARAPSAPGLSFVHAAIEDLTLPPGSVDLVLANASLHWVPAHPAQTDPINEISLFYEDRTLMDARIGRLRHPRALDIPVRTSHVIGNVRTLGRTGRGDLIVTSRFQMIEFIADAQRLHGGAVTHHLSERDGGWKIRLKRIDLVNAGGVFDLLQGFF